MTQLEDQTQKDATLDNFEKYALALGAGFLLFLIPVSAVIYAVLVLFIVTLLLLYKERKQFDAESHERKALQALITIFWRFSYLSIISFLVAASFLLAFGDSSALQGIQSKLEAGVMVPESEMVAAMHTYQGDNRTVIIFGNSIGFLPLVSYCVLRLKKTVDAFKAKEEIAPKAWR